MIIFASQHPIPLLRMSWEGLYVALSRVKYREHIRMAIRKDDPERYSLEYMVRLRKNKYTDSFFQGYKPIHADGMENKSQLMVWNRSKAWEAAGFDKLAEEMKKPKHKKRRTMQDIQNMNKKRKKL